jgi:hypothetical protein
MVRHHSELRTEVTGLAYNAGFDAQPTQNITVGNSHRFRLLMNLSSGAAQFHPIALASPARGKSEGFIQNPADGFRRRKARFSVFAMDSINRFCYCVDVAVTAPKMVEAIECQHHGPLGFIEPVELNRKGLGLECRSQALLEVFILQHRRAKGPCIVPKAGGNFIKPGCEEAKTVL